MEIIPQTGAGLGYINKEIKQTSLADALCFFREAWITFTGN
jgi:hypothetical protein